MSKMNINPFLSLLKLDIYNTGDLTKSEIVTCISQATNFDLMDEKYLGETGSASNRLREFTKKEEDKTVYLAMNRILEEWIKRKKENYKTPDANLSFLDSALYTESEEKNIEQCTNELNKIKPKNIKTKDLLHNINTFENYTLEELQSDISEKITQGKYHMMIGQLHTFCVGYFRKKCEKNKITIIEKEELQSLLKKSTDSIQDKCSPTSFQIIKMSRSIFEKFNNDRNNKSPAHFNELLNKNDAEFISQSIINLLVYIDSIDKK